MSVWLYIIIGVLIIAAIAWLVHHQHSLKLRAHLMQEAIRNRDFTFRLPTDGLLPGERAMQQTLNQLGQTIRQQVNQNEVESWERLTRVLTHEMMNATAPIASISQSLLSREDVKGTPLEEGIHAIFTTSQHMNSFIDSYRKLSQLQQPTLESLSLASLIKDVCQLYPAVGWDCCVADTIIVSADESMLHQILVNLIKNAIEAGARHIALEASSDTQQPAMVSLYVSNDGQQIGRAHV